MNKKHSLPLALTLGLLALVGILLSLEMRRGGTSVAHAQGTIRYVAPTGTDTGICTDPITPCKTIQYAVDQALPGEEVRVATGVYTDVHARSTVTQVVYISKTVTVRGGYSADFGEWDPAQYTTTLDARRAGRVLVIVGEISPTVEGLRITGGRATDSVGGPGGPDSGGGVYIISATATLSNNQVFDNVAFYGGGLFLSHSPAIIRANVISNNHCLVPTLNAFGGGLYLYHSPALLSGNRIVQNNIRFGGGLYLDASDAVLAGNTIADNLSISAGAGIYVENSAPILYNNLIAENLTYGNGGGLCIISSSPRLLHTTIVSNTDQGLYATNASTVVLTNTILARHGTGIYVQPGNTARLEGTLWGSGVWANGSDWEGGGTIITGTVNLWAEPDFVAPEDGDYHLLPTSAAVDAGVDSGIDTDIDGDPRPLGKGYDLGADEVWVELAVFKEAIPDPVVPGGILTYTLYLTNTGVVNLHPIVTDTLPAHVTPTGMLTWAVPVLAPGAVWTQAFTVTVETGYLGPLTNVVEAVSVEGAADVYTETTTAYLCFPPTAVSLTGPATATVGASVALTASVAPPTATTPFTYTWQATGQTPIVHTGGLSDTATFTWTLSGAQVVTVTAANGCGAVTATHVITVETPPTPCTPPGDADLTGPATTTVGAAAAFTASVAPPTTTTPFTYTWRATGQTPITHTGGLSDTAAFTWTVSGAQVVTVTAANACGAVTATRVITVESPPTPCTPPERATLTGPATTTVGASVAFTASVSPPTATTPLTYTWRAAGQAPITHSGGLSDTATFTWTAAGTQVVTVTAANACGAVTATRTLTVEAAGPTKRWLYLPLVLRNR